MKKLWQTNGDNLDPIIESFETKGDLVEDQKLLKFDVYGSIAHVKMLAKIGILSNSELSKILEGLHKILKLAQDNTFQLEQGEEDVHTKIETYLTENYGQVGKKVHTGRSRNDQVLTALRLFSKEKMLFLWKDLITVIETFQKFAKKYEFVPMPGYTHMQKAMPSSVGMWAASFVESFLDDLTILESIYLLNDRSPLGSAAGYGVPINLDREYSAKLLGFNHVQVNPLYCQNSRGKVEATIIAVLNSAMLSINKFATDVLLFTTSEFNFFDVSSKLYSGSSIMPQKKNVDIAELLRSKVHITSGNYLQVVGILSNLPSGYNRDLQDFKKPFMESFEIAEDCLKVTNILLNNLTPIKGNLKKALTPEIFATHKAFKLVAKGTPFREAYQVVGKNGSKVYSDDIDNTLKESTHIGGTGNLQLKMFEQLIKQKKTNFNKANEYHHSAINKLLK